MKKIKLLVILATLICAITALCVCANAATYSGTCGANGSNLTWTLNTTTGKLVINGTGAMEDWSDSSDVPWYSCRSYIKTVTLGESVTSIGSSAFAYCDSLASVEIPASVTSIGEAAFYQCTSLASVEIPASVTIIGYAAFRDCDSLESITVDEANTNYSSDEYGVLFNKNKTTLIQYPIGNSRTEYTVPNSVTNIGYSAFAYCDSLESVDMPSVTSIDSHAFYNCYSLESVEIPASVTSIGEYAFAYCDSLASVEIPASVTSIGYAAFRACDSLESITVDEANTKYSSDEHGVLFNKNKTTLIQYPIGNSRIEYTVPNSVTSIGYEAFYDCDNLASVDMPSVTSIGSSAFEYCDSPASVDMPSVTSIGSDAFYDCDSLASVDMPNVTSIGNEAFIYCSNLKKAVVYSTAATFGSDVFYRTHADFEIHGYTGSTAETYANENGHTFVPLIEEYNPGDADRNGVVNIRDAAIILQFIAGWNVEINEDAADTDGNGTVNIRDAARILQYIAGWNVTLG